MPNVFDERGIIIKGIDEFRKEMSDSAKIAFADKLDGKELRVDDSSMLGRIFATVAKPLVQSAEILPLIFQAFDINSAEGQQLDNLLWGIHRIKRKAESQATGYVILYGDLGTYVAQGSSVGNSLTGDSYQTDDDVTFSRLSANGVDISISAVGGSYSLTYSIDGYLSESPAIIVQTGSTDTTIRNVADRFVDAVNSQSSYLSATRNNDNSVKVIIIDQSLTGDFTTTGSCSITRSYMPVYVTSSTYDAQESTQGQITSIQTPTLGWRGVTNPYYVFPSVGVESDEKYRYRGKLLQQNNSGKYTSILMALKSVRGVVYENVQQNTSSNTTNSGIINNGLSITVMGGNEDDIALAIFQSVSEGIMTSGDIVKEVKDINGFGHEVRFSRPTISPLQITMSLVTYPDFPTNGNARIKAAIVEWFNNLNVGEDIHYSRLYEPINSIDGFAVRNLKFGYKGGTLGLEDIIIQHNEIATISAEDISIGGA
ncbi:Baseplate wedge protein [Psychrobacter phage D'Alembert]|nr:Baseplate wedge protein [Psychrobacter phage D'Alembert]